MSKFKVILMSLSSFTFVLASCQNYIRPGGVTKFTAIKISHNPVKEVKTLKDQGYTFTYYNVYSDNDGNFIMKDNSSFIINDDFQFGMKVKSPFVYKLNDNNNDEELIEYDYLDEEGYYNYTIVYPGIIIYGIDREASLNYENINIGYIFHWC